MAALKSNKEIRNYANHYVRELGGIEKFIKEISKAINDLSKDGAIGNVNQIYYLTRVLFYLRYEYSSKNYQTVKTA
jgi:hypothetical protein